jgi:hypothetical protein
LALAVACPPPEPSVLFAATAPPTMAKTSAITEMIPGMPKRSRSNENIASSLLNCMG